MSSRIALRVRNQVSFLGGVLSVLLQSRKIVLLRERVYVCLPSLVGWQGVGENFQVEKVASKFWMIGLLNGFLAIVFTAPILVPSLCIATPPGQFGCAASMETSWPGTWLLVAYFTFLIVGVVGPFAWALAYSRKSSTEGKTESSKTLSWLHLLLFEVGVLGATGMMAAIGYAGGNVVAHGGSAIVSAEAVRTQIIPPLSSDPNSVLWDMPPVIEAIFIGLTLLSQLLGFLNLVTLKKTSATT
jgi:hypothetical protein